MAASQARFLGLTARKSNVEYQGQQVNQQRTMLANESAALFNQLVTLNPPVPPDTNNYYSTKYTFTDGDTEYEIISGLGTSTPTIREKYVEYDYDTQPVNHGGSVTIERNNNTLYLISNSLKMQLSKLSNSSVQIGNLLDRGINANQPYFTFKDNQGTKYQNKLNNLGTLSDIENSSKANDFVEKLTSGVPTYYATENSDGSKNYIKLTAENYEEAMANNYEIFQEARDENNQPIREVVTNENDTGLEIFFGENSSNKFLNVPRNNDGSINITQELWQSATAEEKEYILENLTDTPNNKLYLYTNNGITTYLQASYLDVFTDDTQEAIVIPSIQQSFYESSYERTRDVTLSNAEWTQDPSTGRYSHFVGLVNRDGKQKNYNLTCTQVFDDDAYNQAIQNYEYEQYLYEQQQSEINAKTETIQQQDKVLELNLKQLDTERNALQTEMEAVGKVVKDNVEKTFKTFNG